MPKTRSRLTFLMGLAFLGHYPSQASAQAYRYYVTIIPPLAGHSYVSTNAINNRGEVVGVSYGSPIYNQTPYVYRPASGVQPLPFPSGYAFSVPTDINDNGVIVGYAQPSWPAEQSMVAWKYENGQLSVFPGISFGNNVNSSGTVVGRSCLSGTSLTCYFEAPAGGSMQTVAASSFYSSTQWRLVDINDAGQILYTAPSPGLAQRRESNGSLTPLPAPPAPFARTYTWAINNSGRCAARWEYNVGSQYFSRAFVWDPGSGPTTVGIVNNYVVPKGLNNLGHVVGESGGNQSSVLNTWIWTPQRGNEDLAPLVDPALQIAMTGVSGINDAGQIIARGVRGTPPVVDIQFILTPTGLRGDINADGIVDAADRDILINVLLQLDADPAHLTGADVNGDGAANGADIQTFVALLP